MTLSKWFFAHWYETLNSVVEPKVSPHRKNTAGKCTGEILELGAGGGLNLPYFDQNSLDNQKKLYALQNKKNILFCGSYFGYGFHEDGIKSSINMIKSLND